MNGCWDYGPLGVELLKNIKEEWWKVMTYREDVEGIDAAILMHPRVWEASGHVENFTDPMIDCKQCKSRFRLDVLGDSISEKKQTKAINELKNKLNGKDDLLQELEGIYADPGDEDPFNLVLENERLGKLLLEELNCPQCGNKNTFTEARKFNLMFKTFIGPVEDTNAVVYLRPETAQGIYVNFLNVQSASRQKLPFGIAQIGKAFRNEISPRDFLFRAREFEQLEIEYFVRPKESKCPLLTRVHRDMSFKFYSAKDQKNGRKQKKVILSSLISKRIIGQWHAYWLAESYKWFLELGINATNLRVREHTEDERSHYSSGTFDIDYNFPFGWKEIFGIANRGQFDLTEHEKYSGRSMHIYDEVTKEKLIPRVIEPSFGLDRAFLTVIYNAYHDDKDRGNIVLKLHPKLAPIQVAVFPLVNKLDEDALKVYLLLKKEFRSTFDRSGSIGRRYARADEIGIPFCITYDFDSLKDNSVTIRQRDTTKQIRVPITNIKQILSELITGSDFDSQGKPVK